nr:MAG TPA: hypothetical protein [Bacteriophage sp.]DAL02265.1 MAG TPA: hypothetical protein [Caudoviricetes sp.]
MANIVSLDLSQTSLLNLAILAYKDILVNN